MDVYTRPYDGGDWQNSYGHVILITPTSTGQLLYQQDGAEYVKMMFPVTEGLTWPGNQYVQWQDTTWSYLKNWTYVYQNVHMGYFNGLVNFDNTVTVLLDNENVNYQNVDSAVAGYKTYAKEVYAYGVGLIYKVWTHTTWVEQCKKCKRLQRYYAGHKDQQLELTLYVQKRDRHWARHRLIAW